MWSACVVIDPPFFDGPSGVGQIGKPVLVQAFIAELSIESFDEGVLDGLARFDEVKPDAVTVRPFIQRLADQLRAIIDNDSARQLPCLRQALQDPDHPRSG